MAENQDLIRAALRAFMDANDIVPAKWAAAAGVSDRTLPNFLAGRAKTMTYATLQKFADAAGCSVAEMLAPGITDSCKPEVDLSHSAASGELSDEDIMNLQLLVRLLQELRRGQEETNDLLRRLIGDKERAESGERRGVPSTIRHERSRTVVALLAADPTRKR